MLKVVHRDNLMTAFSFCDSTKIVLHTVGKGRLHHIPANKDMSTSAQVITDKDLVRCYSSRRRRSELAGELVHTTHLVGRRGNHIWCHTSEIISRQSQHTSINEFH